MTPNFSCLSQITGSSSGRDERLHPKGMDLRSPNKKNGKQKTKQPKHKKNLLTLTTPNPNPNPNLYTILIRIKAYQFFPGL